jgi:hypothetical protein
MIVIVRLGRHVQPNPVHPSHVLLDDTNRTEAKHHVTIAQSVNIARQPVYPRRPVIVPLDIIAHLVHRVELDNPIDYQTGARSIQLVIVLQDITAQQVQRKRQDSH